MASAWCLRYDAAVVTRPRPSWIAPAAIAVVGALCRLPSFLRPISDTDEAIYASVAALTNAGGKLYLDGGVDMKVPGIFWIYSAVFHAFGRYAMSALHAVTLLVVLATAAVLGAGAARVGGRRAGLLAALFYAVFSSVFYPQMLAANTEVFMMLPLCASGVVLLRRPFSEARPIDLFGSALLVAIACAWKQVALVNAPLLVYVAWRARAHRRCLLAALAGAAVGFALPLAILWRTSSVTAMWHWAFARVATHYGPSGWSALGYATDLGKTGALFIVATLPLGAALVLRPARTEAARLVLRWCALSYLAVLVSGHFFGHYYLQLVGPLALYAGVAFAERTPRAIVPLTLLTGLAFAVVAVVVDPVKHDLGSTAYLEAAAWVRGHTRPDERIFVWGDAAPMYVTSDRLPATRFVGFLRGIDRSAHESPEHGWDCGAEVWPLFAEDVAAHPPAIIVDTSTLATSSYHLYPITLFPAIADLVARDYRLEANVAGMDVYRRRR